MAIATLLTLDRGDGKNYFGLPPANKWARTLKRSKTWMILERRNGYWTAVAILDHKPSLLSEGQKLVREYK